MSGCAAMAGDQGPARILSGPMRDELRKGVDRPGRPRVFVGLELALPSGTRRYCKVGLDSATRGAFNPYVMKWGMRSRVIDERQSRLAAIEVSPEISDTTRDFSRELAGHRGTIRRSTATIRLMSPNVSDADSLVLMSGILDAYDEVQPMVWRLRIRANDVPLRLGVVPKVAVNTIDWPAADSKAVAQYVPIIYGTHDSVNLDGKGCLPTLYVDTLAFKYLVGLGQLKTIKAVYVAGVLTASSNYTVTYPTINGKTFTVITFTAGQGSSAVTCDVDGLTDRGDGTGNLITNPATQFQHFLTNFVWGDWRSGNYVDPSTAPLHAASFAITGDYLDALGHEGSRWVGGSTQLNAENVLNEWLLSHETKAYWRGDGLLAIRLIDHRGGPPSLAYITDPVVFANENETAPFTMTFDSKSIARQISIQYVREESANAYKSTLEAADLSVSEKVLISRQLPWSASRLT